MEKKSNPLATTPIEEEKISLVTPKTVAAGIPALISSARHALKEMDFRTCTKTLFSVNQMKGFDCPGCAWPDPDEDRSGLGEYCENGVKAIAEEATSKRVGPDFFEKHSVEELSHWSDYKLGKSGRLTHPMILREGKNHYEEIAWEDAFQLIGKELNALASPNEAIFYTSGRTSNEAAFLYQLFVRAFGTNNLPDCSNMCHESSGVALSETVGIGKGSVKLEDFYLTDLIIVVGQNPGTNHPRMLSALQISKKQGAKIMTVNPLPETGLIKFKHPQKVGDMLGSGTALTDLFLQVKINQDIALFKAIMKLMWEAEQQNPGQIFDLDFIKNNTTKYEAFVVDLKKHDINQLVEMSGVPLEQIQTATQMIIQSKKIIICWAMGLTQHKNGVYNIKECVNLLLLKGSVGKEGAGTCPVRGHSNVQGDRTVGIVHRTSEAMSKTLKENYGVDSPKGHGYDTVHSIKAMYEGKAKVFVALGGNFLSAASDTLYTAQALQNCDLTVAISTKLNRSHLVAGKTALILPTLGRSEKDERDGQKRMVTVENSMGKVHTSRGSLTPASEHLMSEPDIIAQIAATTLQDKTQIDWLTLGKDYDLIRDQISIVIKGFENYNQRVKKDSGFYLPNNARAGDFSKLPNGLAQFTVCPLPEHSLAADEFLLTTIRSHDQFNTTIYGLHDRYRGDHNERRVVFINPNDMERLGLEKLDLIDLTSEYDGVVRHAPKFYAVPYSIPEGNLGCYFPEGNVLIPIDEFADQSCTPVSKSVRVRVGKR